jgi:hypothetical protein
MTLTVVQTLTTFQSASGGQSYFFDISVDSLGKVEVRNVRTELGLIMDPVTGVPQSVLDDMLDAKVIVQQTGTETQVDSGTLVFNGVTEVSAAIAGGLLNNTNYRVAYTTPDGTVLRTTNQTTTGFTAEAPAVYGTVPDPIDVPYVVLVAAQQASTTSGVLTFVSADASVKTVTFTQAMAADDYRVILTPSDFFVARVANQSKTGFDVVINHTLSAAGSVTVGYDVFVG